MVGQCICVIDRVDNFNRTLGCGDMYDFNEKRVYDPKDRTHLKCTIVRNWKKIFV